MDMTDDAQDTGSPSLHLPEASKRLQLFMVLPLDWMNLRRHRPQRVIQKQVFLPFILNGLGTPPGSWQPTKNMDMNQH